jgi:hypothetical protein
MPLPHSSLWPATLLAAALAGGCAATPARPSASPSAAAPAPPAPAAPPAGSATPGAAPAAGADALPPLLHDLDLTAAQTKELLRIVADFNDQTDTFRSAAEALARSIAGAARMCKGTTPFVDADAERLVREGEELRAPLLDAFQRAHRVLTPAQRRKLSARLVEGDDWAKRERRNAQRAGELGPDLELRAMQLMSVLVKAGTLWARIADRAEPWREHYRTAITDFARDDFDVHEEPVAKAPAVKLVVDFVREGLGMIMPVLDPKQCEALGNLIDAKFDEQVAEAAARAARVRAALGP